MYLISNESTLSKVVTRGIFLSKKFNKKNHKSTLVYLRSPKHFNIGKHKIFFFKNRYKDELFFSMKISTKILIFYEHYFFKIIFKLLNIHNLKRINSIRVNTKTKIKWNTIKW